MHWQPCLAFASSELEEHARKLTTRANKAGDLEPRQKWLGVYFQREIQEGYLPSCLSVEWINTQIGFGVFASQSIAAGAFIGEYTGTVRPRCKKLDRTNDYCFEYAIGEKSPWVIDAREGGNQTRFINHATKGNLEPLFVCSLGLMHLILITTQKIEAGAQLVYPYGPHFWKKRTAPESLFSLDSQ